MSPSSTASPSSSAFAPGSPPASSAVFPDPFTSHLPRGGAERRMREASTGSSWDRTGETEAEAEAEAEASWGDFQEAPQTPPQLSLPPSPKLAPATRAPPKPARTYPDPATLSARAPARPVRAGTGAPAGAGHVGGGFDPAAQPIRLVGLRDGVARVLDEDVAEGIRPALPPRLRHSPRWTLLYSLDQHGISLSTLFTNLERGLSSRDGGFVLVLRTERAEVCGGYVSEALKRPSSEREGHGRERWVGDGSCFLFHTRPFPPSDPRLGLAVKTFKPTFRNSYFAHASPSASSSSSSSRSYTSGSFSPPPGAAVDAGFIALGGGNDGVFGLWLDGVLERGWTGRSETYANEPLVVGDGQGAGGRGFEVVGLECWAVGS
ncbi:oxidation resistance protein 1 [Rhodosporidiobolus nylandii]